MKHAVSAIAAAHIAARLNEARLDFAAPIVHTTVRWVNEAEKPLIANDDGSTVFVGSTFCRGDHGFREGDIRRQNPWQKQRKAKQAARQRDDQEVVKYCEERKQKVARAITRRHKLDRHGVNRGRRLAKGALKIAHLDEAASVEPWGFKEPPQFDHDLYLVGVDPDEIHIHLNS